MTHPKVADLSVNEFKELVREVVLQTLSEMIVDPDEGMELRDDFAEELQHSLATAAANGETIPAIKVAENMGITW